MADTNGVQTINWIVKRIIRKMGVSKAEYKHFVNLVIDGYIDLRLFHAAKGIRDVKLTIDTDTDSVDFPSDFIEMVGVFVQKDGELYELTNNEKLIKTTTGTSPEVRDGGDVYLQTTYAYSTRGAVNPFGYYVVDYEKSRILFINLEETTEEITLQYKTSGVSTTETTYIPVHYYPALEAYVRWQNSIDTKPNLMREYERLYNIEAKKLKYLTMPSAEEFKDILRRNYTQLFTR